MKWGVMWSTEVYLEKLKRSESFGDADVEGKVIFQCFINTKLAKLWGGPETNNLPL